MREGGDESEENSSSLAGFLYAHERSHIGDMGEGHTRRKLIIS